MSLQCLLLIPIRIKDMNLGIIQRNDDILWSKMQTRHHPLILRYMSCNVLPARSPRRFYQVSLLEM
jgi:hypothetical protein